MEKYSFKYLYILTVFIKPQIIEENGDPDWDHKSNLVKKKKKEALLEILLGKETVSRFHYKIENHRSTEKTEQKHSIIKTFKVGYALFCFFILPLFYL